MGTLTKFQVNLVLPENLQDIWMTEGYFTIQVNRISALQFLPNTEDPQTWACSKTGMGAMRCDQLLPEKKEL